MTWKGDYNLRIMRLSNEGLDECAKMAREGNIPAKLALMSHNQGVLNDKLNELSDSIAELKSQHQKQP